MWPPQKVDIFINLTALWFMKYMVYEIYQYLIYYIDGV